MVATALGATILLVIFWVATALWVTGALLGLRAAGVAPYAGIVGTGPVLWAGEVGPQRVELRAWPVGSSIAFAPPDAEDDDALMRLPWRIHAALALWALVPSACLAVILRAISGDPQVLSRAGRIVGILLGVVPGRLVLSSVAAVTPDRAGLGVAASALVVWLTWSMIPVFGTASGAVLLKLVWDRDEFLAFRLRGVQVAASIILFVAVLGRVAWLSLTR